MVACHHVTSRLRFPDMKKSAKLTRAHIGFSLKWFGGTISSKYSYLRQTITFLCRQVRFCSDSNFLHFMWVKVLKFQKVKYFILFSWVFSLGVATTDFSMSFNPLRLLLLSICLCIPTHHIHKLSHWPFSFPPAWQLQFYHFPDP